MSVYCACAKNNVCLLCMPQRCGHDKLSRPRKFFDLHPPPGQEVSGLEKSSFTLELGGR